MDFIDYTNSNSIDENLWTFTSYKKFFCDTYWKIHKVGGAVPWTIKETMLLKRMMEEFKPVDLADMITHWHTNHKSSVACKFDNFYCTRIDVYHKLKEATGEYSWE